MKVRDEAERTSSQGPLLVGKVVAPELGVSTAPLSLLSSSHLCREL
jgi:hypothetical protein